LDFSTVLTVVDHVILYPTKCETRAADMGMDMPVKKIAKKAWVSTESWKVSVMLTNPLELVQRHLPAARQLKTVPQRDRGDITDTDEKCDTGDCHIPGGQVIPVKWD
jgi:hypothetical protein